MGLKDKIRNAVITTGLAGCLALSSCAAGFYYSGGRSISFLKNDITKEFYGEYRNFEGNKVKWKFNKEKDEVEAYDKMGNALDSRLREELFREAMDFYERSEEYRRGRTHRIPSYDSF